ncbi:MAG: hypothetical protein E7347_04520 [Clostridiales bacterium]|nr:hypothetical protein [Clostridiales bacterium]
MGYIGAFTQVWTNLVTWFVTLFEMIASIFVTTGAEGAIELTFVGTCAVIMAGVALLLLAFNLIRSFVRMRG